jgi:tetratricopeptide (TPR) repeat protein
VYDRRRGATVVEWSQSTVFDPPGDLSLDNPSFFFPIVDAGAYDAIARELAANGNISPRLFWQPFLYPVFLAATYLISGGSILAAKVLQAIIGSLTCSLVFILGNRQLGKNVGLAAATITALYGPVILFEGELLAAGLAAFFAVLLVLLFTIVADRSRPLLVVTLGIVAGLSLLTRPTIAPFLAVTSLVLLLLAGRRRGWKPALVSAGLGLSGFLLVVIPVALLSQSVTGDLGVLPSSGGLNAYIGNNPSMCETLTIRPGDDWGRLLDQPNRAGYEGPAESNRYFYREVGRFAREEPSRFLIGLGAKTLRLISSRELPRNFDPYLAGEWSWLQRGLTWKVGHFGFPFGLLLPLAVVGVARSWRRLGLPAILFMTLYPAAIILIFVAARYRAPMIPVLSLAAAAGGAALISDFRRRRWRRLGIAASAMTAIVLLSTVPGPFCEEEASLRADFFYCLGHSHAERGEPDLAISSYQQALAENPNLPQVHYNLGLLFESRDDLDQAASHFTEATRLDPAHARALNNLGSVAESRGDLEEAERRFTRALGLDPELAVAQRNLGNVRLQLGRPGEALEPLRKALELEAQEPSRVSSVPSS